MKRLGRFLKLGALAAFAIGILSTIAGCSKEAALGAALLVLMQFCSGPIVPEEIIAEIEDNGFDVPITAVYFNGFEQDAEGWEVFSLPVWHAERVPSGTNGVNSCNGDFHAEAGYGPHSVANLGTNGSAATNWGGYEDVFPVGGYSTFISIFLDVDGGFANDTRFDFSSAINNTGGTHLRDFIFNCGFYDDAAAPGSGNRFVCSTSNNSIGWPKDPAREPTVIATESGCYGFHHQFRDNAGFLQVTFSIFDPVGTLVKSWVQNTTDAMAGVGGNRYGWYAHNAFPFLAFDNALLTKP